MPAILLTLLPFLKKAAPYLAGIALVVAAYWWADSRGRDAQKAKDAKTITALQTALDQSTANVKTLTAAIATQTADSNARAAAYTASSVQNDKDVKAANARWEQTQIAASRLATIVKSRQGSTGCVAGKDLTDALAGL